MTSTLIDSNVILDIVGNEAEWASWSAAQVAVAADNGAAVINPIIYAETSAYFADGNRFERALLSLRLRREDLPWEGARKAGLAHALCRQRGGEREGTLPDFLIGAHAEVRGHRLLTRDPRRYRKYFPGLEVIAPDTHP